MTALQFIMFIITIWFFIESTISAWKEDWPRATYFLLFVVLFLVNKH